MKARIDVRFEIAGGEKPCGAVVTIRLPMWLRSRTPVMGLPVTEKWGKVDVESKTREAEMKIYCKTWDVLMEFIKPAIEDYKNEIKAAFEDYKKLKEEMPADFSVEIDDEGNEKVEVE